MYWWRLLLQCPDLDESFQEVGFYFSGAYTTQTNNFTQTNFERKNNKQSTKGPTGRANLFTSIFGNVNSIIHRLCPSMVLVHKRRSMVTNVFLMGDRSSLAV